jgi:hypothetical protein
VRNVIFAFFAALLPAAADAQRFPDRFMTFNPISQQQGGSIENVRWMHSTGGWGEFAAYRVVRDREHAWLQRLGGYLEMVRVGDRTSLAFISNIEFIANPHNDIRFNPRAIFWEEAFLLTSRAGKNYWQLGYFHRCKHDIDNLLIGTERSLIFGSIQGKYLIPFSTNGEVTQGLLAIRTDLYTIRQDDRIPITGFERYLNFKRALGSFGINAHFRRQLRQPLYGLYLTAWSSASLYSDREGILNRLGSIESATLNGGISTGIAIQGNAHFRIGITYEYVSDTGIEVVPSHAHLLSIGIVILNPSTMW